MNSQAEQMNVGTEWMIDARGCQSEPLADLGHMRRLCERIIRELDLKVIGDGQWHQFAAPGGVTGLYLLTESHLACHTYPELGVATFNLYCCRPRPRWLWEARLQAMLGAASVSVRWFTREAVGNEAVPADNALAVHEVANP
jgi:S-adenosylmethionine decarboxylase